MQIIVLLSIFLVNIFETNLQSSSNYSTLISGTIARLQFTGASKKHGSMERCRWFGTKRFIYYLSLDSSWSLKISISFCLFLLQYDNFVNALCMWSLTFYVRHKERKRESGFRIVELVWKITYKMQTLHTISAIDYPPQHLQSAYMLVLHFIYAFMCWTVVKN